MAEHNAETVILTPTNLININMSNVTKLTAGNYLMWSLQVHALLDGYALAKYLDGAATIPDPEITVGTVRTPNPAFEFWTRQDRLIYSGLIGAITVSVQPLVSRANTSADVWITLVKTYAKPS